MEHQKRRRMQHKVELSTLLKLVVASSKEKVANNVTTENVCRQLAQEALDAIQRNDLSLNAYKLSA
ncbi:hypothetical protein I5907_08215 [Panacibacter sp. DH6]|uniref:Uncharacterized protein n=1 Tax=Panacibacter microcysteis TaxID=2793269 RepID=A0A931E9L4_9BACT|nr:hypothetical protein [Panacibacter microcysteis]MBG9376216.1 hypothetical protein [Panacibacter microcysteis]